MPKNVRARSADQPSPRSRRPRSEPARPERGRSGRSPAPQSAPPQHQHNNSTARRKRPVAQPTPRSHLSVPVLQGAQQTQQQRVNRRLVQRAGQRTSVCTQPARCITCMHTTAAHSIRGTGAEARTSAERGRPRAPCWRATGRSSARPIAAPRNPSVPRCARTGHEHAASAPRASAACTAYLFGRSTSRRWQYCAMKLSACMTTTFGPDTTCGRAHVGREKRVCMEGKASAHLATLRRLPNQLQRLRPQSLIQRRPCATKHVL